MVRKRSRTSRKYYDEDNDSDSDFGLEDPPVEPAQKKYSLRQRKRRLFTEFEFDDDGDEIEPTKAPSDDDDFDVEKEVQLNSASDTEYYNNQETYLNDYQPENDDIPEDADGLIDFEDMIRADIVVNKNRIDYDNIIQKTEIKVQPIEEMVQPVIKAKRGRKPKVRPQEEVDSSILEPETEMQDSDYEDKNDRDYNPEDDMENEEPIDCAQLMHAELSESGNELLNSISKSEIKNEEETEGSKMEEREILNIQEANVQSKNIEEDVKAPQEPVVRNTDILSAVTEDIPDVNGGKTLPQMCPEKCTAEEVNSQTSIRNVVAVDDDDVVLVEDEKRVEVIVLDD